MKFVVEQLAIGQMVVGQVVEIFVDDAMLVSFRGDLVRVTNQTGKRFVIGGQISLRVLAIQPLAFQLLGADKNKFDVSV